MPKVDGAPKVAPKHKAPDPNKWHAPAMIEGLAGRHTGDWPPLIHCGEPSCSAFQNVSLVLMLTFTERMQMLSGYADWFASLLFFLTSHTVDNALREDTEACDRCHKLAASWRRTGCHCAHFYSPMRHLHYGRAFSRAIALATAGGITGGGNRSHHHHSHLHGSSGGLRMLSSSSSSGSSSSSHLVRSNSAGGGPIGVLMCHFDFFLNVRIFHGARFDLPWFPRRGQVIFSDPDDPVPRCFPINSTVFAKDKSWFWFEEGKAHCKECVIKLNGAECCYGWADIIYVPRPMLKAYGTLLQGFPEVHHEIAVPTALRMLSLKFNVTPRALSCNGGTIGRMHNTRFGPCCGRAQTTNGFCAHRLNLSHTDHQEVVRSMLHDRW